MTTTIKHSIFFVLITQFYIETVSEDKLYEKLEANYEDLNKLIAEKLGTTKTLECRVSQADRQDTGIFLLPKSIHAQLSVNRPFTNFYLL